jgi:hypothetical protein
MPKTAAKMRSANGARSIVYNFTYQSGGVFKYLMRSIQIFACLYIAALAAFAQGTNVTLSVQGNAALTGTNAFAVTGSGSITGYGTAVLSVAGTVDESVTSGQTAGPIPGTFTLVFPSGDVLVGTFSIPAGILVPFIGGSSSATGTATITGGTGKFAGAAGSFPAISGSGTATGATTSNITFSGNGTLSVGQKILPQLVFGQGWYTALYFTNTGTTSVSFVVSFVADDGTPLIVPSINNSSVTVNLAPGQSTILQAPNSGAFGEGYASLTLPTGVTAYGVFRQSVSGRADQEAVVPLSGAAATNSTLIWDDTNGDTAVAMVNPSSQTATLTITVRNAAGNILGASALVLPPKGKKTAVLNQLPGLAGMKGANGSATFSVSTGSVAVLGLRFEGVAFTSVPTTDN